MTSQATLKAKLVQALQEPTYRVSTKKLDILDSVVKTGSLYYGYSSNPSATLAGAAGGLLARHIIADQPREKKSEQHQRAQLVASMCLTICAAAYAGYTPGTHEYVPFIIGFTGAADGVYPLLYRIVN